MKVFSLKIMFVNFRFRDEEQEHHDIGLEEDAEQAPMYEALTGVIKVGCKAAIWLSERV